MNAYKKFAGLLVFVVLASLVITACGSGSTGGKFPTGRFNATSDQFAGYVFNQDGTWEYFWAGSTQALGKYVVKGDQWTEQGTTECPFPGTYRWSYDGTNLKFTLVGEDKCDPRRVSTDGQTFVVVK